MDDHLPPNADPGVGDPADDAMDVDDASAAEVNDVADVDQVGEVGEVRDAEDLGEVAPVGGGEVARPRWSSRIAPLSLMVAAVIVVLDQVTKHWAVNELAGDREIHVVWTLQWNLSFNTGMAFSRGQGLGPVIGLLAMLVVIVLVISIAHVENRLARFAAGMLIGGAIGNLVDRLFRGDGWLHGAVVDFIDFQWFPIFNVADIGVTVGATLFALASLFDGATGRHRASEIPPA